MLSDPTYYRVTGLTDLNSIAFNLIISVVLIGIIFVVYRKRELVEKWVLIPEIRRLNLFYNTYSVTLYRIHNFTEPLSKRIMISSGITNAIALLFLFGGIYSLGYPTIEEPIGNPVININLVIVPATTFLIIGTIFFILGILKVKKGLSS